MNSPRPDLPDELQSHLGFVRGLALALVRDPELASDIAQDAALAALSQRPRAARGLGAWLRGTVRNLAGLHARRQALRSKAEAEVAHMGVPTSPGGPSGEDALAAAERSRILMDAVARLPEHYRVVIVLRYLEQLQPMEIAARLEMPIDTVRTRLARGLGRLRRSLGGADGEQGPEWLAVILPLLPRPAPASAAPWAAPAAVAAAVAVGGAAVVGTCLAAFGGEARTDPAAADDPAPVAATDARVEGARDALEAGGETAARVELTAAADDEDGSPAGPARRLRVVSAASGRPVRGASFLRASDEPEAGTEPYLMAEYFPRSEALAPHRPAAGEARSDADGLLALPDPGGRARALRGRVAARGFVASAPLELRAGGPDEVEVSLEPAGTLALVRGARAPAQPLHVRLLSPERGASSPWIELPRADSALSWRTLPPGRYELLAVAGPEPPAPHTPVVGIYGLFHGRPGTLAGGLFHRTVRVDAEARTEVALFDHRGVDVRVRVAGSPGGRALTASLETVDFPAVLAAVDTDADGRLAFPAVTPGTYVLRILAAGEGLARRRVEVPDGTEYTELEVVLPGGRLLVDAAGEGASHFLLVGPLGVGAASIWDRIGERARFDALPPGEYELWRTGDRLERGSVTVGGGTSYYSADELEPASHELRVRVDAPGGELAVSVYGAHGFELEYEEADGGSLVTIPVAPGTYRVVASRDAARWFRTVTVDADTTLELHAAHLVERELTLLREREPLASELVGVRPQGFPPLEDWLGTALRTGASGTLRVRLEPGSYVLRDAPGSTAKLPANAPPYATLELVP